MLTRPSLLEERRLEKNCILLIYKIFITNKFIFFACDFRFFRVKLYSIHNNNKKKTWIVFQDDWNKIFWVGRFWIGLVRSLFFKASLLMITLDWLFGRATAAGLIIPEHLAEHYPYLLTSKELVIIASPSFWEMLL